MYLRTSLSYMYKTTVTVVWGMGLGHSAERLDIQYSGYLERLRTDTQNKNNKRYPAEYFSVFA
jgi:hypothetical protein